MKRRASIPVLVLSMLVALAQPAGAAQTAAPYDATAVTTSERPDVTGHGTADASAAADASAGTVSVSAEATEDLVAGTIVPGLGAPVGHSSAEGSARMIEEVWLPPAAGPRTITVRALIDGIDASAIAQRSLVHTGLTNAQASVTASLEVALQRCPDVFCHPEGRAQDAAPVALSGVAETSTSVVLEVSFSTAFTGDLRLVADAGLFALAGAWGNGVATASGAATVAWLDVTVS